MSDNEEANPEQSLGKDVTKKEEESKVDSITQYEREKKVKPNSDNEVESMQVDESLSDEVNANTDGYHATQDSGSEREINALLENNGKEINAKEKNVNKVKSKVKNKKTKNVQLSMKTFLSGAETPKKQSKNNRPKARERNTSSRRAVQAKSSSSNSGSSTDVAADTESEEENTSKTSKKSKMGNSGFKNRNNRPHMFKRWSDQDTEHYRRGYPGKKDDTNQALNLDFYTNKIESRPDGGRIDDIHKKWWGDYQRLEQHHGYIQWLFPIRENGMNFQAQELQPHEAKAIIDDEIAHQRVLKSYKMMLDFYGMKLNDETFEVERADNWKERFQHLNRSMHNYLRITRILKSLGEFDYEHLKAPFVKFVMKEALEHGTLRNVLNSCLNYWVGTIKNDKERKKLMKYAKDYQSDSH